MKKIQTLTLKKKQQAWVDEHLHCSKEQQDKLQLKKLKQMQKIQSDENQQNILIEQENELRMNRRIEMRKKWLLRQKIKKEVENKRKQQILNGTHNILKGLSSVVVF